MQVNKYVRWRCKLKSSQYLFVQLNVLGVWDAFDSFVCRMTKDGRIVIPKLTMAHSNKGKQNIYGYVAEVTLR